MLDTNKIYLGDAYELIKKIPDNSIDLVYIDPPYLYEKGGNGLSELSQRIISKNKEVLGISDGFDYVILDELVRVMKKINIYVWHSKAQMLPLLNYFEGEKKCWKDIITWCKTNPVPATNNIYLQDTEQCFFFREQGVKLNPGYDLKSRWYISPINVADKKLYDHPTIKPLDLVKRNIEASSNEGDVVLDCFVGSGTTCVAAKELGRNYIGMEIDKKFYQTAVSRVNGITKTGQTSIFTNFEEMALSFEEMSY